MDLIEEEDNEIFENEKNLNIPDEIQRNHEDEEEEDDSDKKPVKVKRIIKNPRVVLNAELLKGPKGLGNLDKCFDRVQFRGKGYEEQDLNIMLKTYEYWCHRMFPKFPFKDCIAKIETLGFKGPIQTHLKKVRSGMIDDETVAILPEFNSENEDNEPAPSNSAESTSQAIMADIPIQLTEEQLETIRINREKAEKLRQERLRRIKEKASINLPEKKVSEFSPHSGQLSEEVDRDKDCILLESSHNMQITSNSYVDGKDIAKSHNQLQESVKSRQVTNVESNNDNELNSIKKYPKQIFYDDEEQERPISREGEQNK